MSIAENPVSQLPVLNSPPAMSNVFPVVNGGQLKRVSYANIVGSWTSYTPTFTNFTVGNAGVTVAEYVRFGNVVALRVHYQLGSTSVVSGAIELSLPINHVSNVNNTTFAAGLKDENGPFYQGVAQLINASTIRLRAVDVSGTYATIADTSATVPFTWAQDDRFEFYAVYEVA